MTKLDQPFGQHEPESLHEIRVTVATRAQIPRIHRLLDRHHYLGSLRPVGERLYYVATTADGDWVAVLVFSAAANHLKYRDRWIRWSEAQRRRRLRLITNNSRFLLLPDRTVPNLGSRVLRLTLERLSQDWQAHYGHPVLVVESFVDPDQFDGTVYRAHGWIELGPTDGWGRHARDFYVPHDQPKRLFVREVRPQATRALQAEHLQPALAAGETPVALGCPHSAKEIGSMVDQFQALSEYRQRIESYPRFSLATIILLAMLCEAPGGQTDLEKFARGLSPAQRRALRIRRNRQGKYPAPSQSTFSRFLAGVDADQLNQSRLAIQSRLRGPAPQEELVVLDGKEPKHGSRASVLSAVTVPSQYYLGSAVVEEKTIEIPVAQKELMPTLDLTGRFVRLDALHTQNETARRVVMEGGGDYLFTVKKNQPTLRANVEKTIAAPQADFPPSRPHAHPSPDPREEQGP